jgi:hypothetical protein
MSGMSFLAYGDVLIAFVIKFILDKFNLHPSMRFGDTREGFLRFRHGIASVSGIDLSVTFGNGHHDL